MHSIWWMVFIVSLSLLVLLLLRSRLSMQWLVYAGLNVVIAGLLLYMVDWAGSSSQFHIPINVPTLAVVAILGVPGLVLLAAVKLVVV
ncbi:pro-sigmaK processing inhibitor BofA family protein [Paenibacillus sp. MBLB4367]|uniref:pro-sigmaK processing inhibitor BofA family protein n=1 Tax=Paenibacillus sp. MBLB4367 TaxID=3384767 RepID=UPI0039083E02